MTFPLLVLTDFSPAADHALAYADALAAHLQTSLVLLHVRRTSFLDQEALTGQLMHWSEGEIAAALADRSGRLSAPVTVEVSAAHVIEATLEAMQRHQPATVLVGKPDTENTPDPLVRSTALDLLPHTRCPVLVVPVQAAVAVPPVRITLAADGTPFALSPESANAPHLLTALGADLTVVHVVAPEDNDSTVVALRSVQESGLLKAAATPAVREVRHSTPASGIREAALTTQADLLLLLGRRHSLLGRLFHQSVTAQVVRHSPVPVLVLPVEG